MKSVTCIFFLFVTFANALRVTKVDPTHVSQVIDHHHHHHVDHDLQSHSADTSEINFPTVSIKEDAAENTEDLSSLTKKDNDHLQNQVQLHIIGAVNPNSLPGHPHNPHKCRHHLRLIGYYPRFIREARNPSELLKGQGDHELQMLDQFIRPHYTISGHGHHHDHRDVKDDQTVEEKTTETGEEMVEDQHEESEKKDKEHEHETSREKDLLIKIRKFLPYF